MRHYPISDEARHRHVQGVGDIPRGQLWLFYFRYDFVSHWITLQMIGLQLPTCSRSRNYELALHEKQGGHRWPPWDVRQY